MGAGKSTVVNIISGRLQPDEGFLELDSNTRLTGISVRAAQASGIETVHQHLALCNKLSAAENIFLGREPVRFSLGPLRFVDRAKAARLAEAEITGVGGRLPRFDVPVEKFSGGQRQAIAIARAVYRANRLIMLDEPTAALGVKQTAATLETIRKVAAKGLAVLMISHNLNDVFEIADRIVSLRLGKVTLDAKKGDVTPSQVRQLMAGIE